MARNPISPALLSRWLGQEHLPTEQQADVIGDQPGPLLVVAGAGAGKTETMAARGVARGQWFCHARPNIGADVYQKGCAAAFPTHPRAPGHPGGNPSACRP